MTVSSFDGGDTMSYASARFDTVVISPALIGMVESPTTMERGRSAASDSKVSGQPRTSQGYPRVIWDQQDIAEYRERIKTRPELNSSFVELRDWADKRIREPLGVPEHIRDADGTWRFPAFTRGSKDDQGNWTFKWDFNTALQNRAADVSNLGIAFALTGNRQYAEYAFQVLLALSDALGHGQGTSQPEPNGFNHFEYYGFDGGDTGMLLSKACSGYDVIRSLTTFAPTDRTRIEAGLFRPLAEQLRRARYMYNGHDRWKMVCLYGIFIAGVTLDDQEMVDGTLYGLAGTKAKPTGGFMDCYQPQYLSESRLWGADSKPEEAIASLAIMTSVAEVMWHRGEDLFRHQGMALKKPFDAGLELIMGTANKSANPDYAKVLELPGATAYEYAYRRFQDPRYLPLIRKLKTRLVMADSQLPSLPLGK